MGGNAENDRVASHVLIHLKKTARYRGTDLTSLFEQIIKFFFFFFFFFFFLNLFVFAQMIVTNRSITRDTMTVKLRWNRTKPKFSVSR